MLAWLQKSTICRVHIAIENDWHVSFQDVLLCRASDDDDDDDDRHTKKIRVKKKSYKGIKSGVKRGKAGPLHAMHHAARIKYRKPLRPRFQAVALGFFLFFFFFGPQGLDGTLLTFQESKHFFDSSGIDGVLVLQHRTCN